MIGATVADIVTARQLNLSAKSKEHLVAMFIIQIALQLERQVQLLLEPVNRVMVGI